MKSEMHAQCAVPVTPERMQLAAGSLLLSHAEEGPSARRMSFDLSSMSYADGRWSARRTLLFVLASNSALWWMIAYALRTVV